MNLSSNFHPWAVLLGTNPVRDECPSGLTRSRVLLQYAFGDGLGRYFQDTNGQGFDGAVNAAGEFETLETSGWTAGYEHWLNDHWMTNFTYSFVQTGSTDALASSTFAQSQYLATTLWWIPIANLSIGLEYLWGEREDLDGQSGRARRMQSAFQYNF